MMSKIHKEQLKEKLRKWKVEVVSSDLQADSLFVEISRNRAEYFGQPQIVRSRAMNALFEKEKPLNISGKIKLQERIHPKNMFYERDQHIFIRGIAGIGKTSLAQYLAYMWADGKYFQDLFDYIIFIECRQLKEKGRGKSATKYLTEFITKNCCIDQMPANGNKVLIILDGLDEYHNLDDAVKRTNGTLGRLLSKDSEFLKGHATLLTSRPHVEHHFCNDNNFGIYTHFEITGLEENQVDDLVDRIANSDSNIAKEIKNKIHSSPGIEKLAIIPRYLELICFLMSDMRKDQDEIINFNTLTPLFTWMFTTLWIKHIEKNRRKARGYYQIFQDPDVSSFLKSLCRCAYELYVKNEIIFSKESFSEWFGQLNYQSIRNMIEAFITNREKEGDESYQFRHLTTMEFFAAAHIFANQIPVEELFEEKYQQVVRFIAGFHRAVAANETEKECKVVKLFVHCVKGNSDGDLKQNAALKRDEWFDENIDHLKPLRDVLTEGYCFFKTLYLLNKQSDNLLQIAISQDDISNFTKLVENLKKRDWIWFLNPMILTLNKLPSGNGAVDILQFLPHFFNVTIQESKISHECCEKLLEALQAIKEINLRYLAVIDCAFESQQSLMTVAKFVTLLLEVSLGYLKDECEITKEILRMAKFNKDTRLRKLVIQSDQTKEEWKDLIAEILESDIHIRIHSKDHDMIIDNK